MKPQMLLMLLLAIPPLISTLLASESAEKADAPVAAKSEVIARDTSAAATTHPAPAPVTPAAPADKAKPAPGTGTSTGIKAWSIM